MKLPSPYPVRTFFLVLSVTTCFFLSIPAFAQSPFLIIHLDAVSSQTLFSELEAGRLPNVARIFNGGTVIRHALTTFPGGTETVYPRLKEGISNREGCSVSWGYLTAETRAIVRNAAVFFELFQHIPRRSRSQFLYGLPGSDFLARLAILNVPSLLDQYQVVEFFWFSTDAAGHMVGADGYLESLQRFDSALGELNRRTDLSKVNVILYSDHGMTMSGIYTVDLRSVVEDIVGDDLEFYSYPNLYLKQGSEVERLAQSLAAHPEIDFVFAQKDRNTVVGYHSQARLVFEEKDGKVRYITEGVDPFGYYVKGYARQFLSPGDWLDMTKDIGFPAVPPNLFNYLQNPNTGDLVLVVNPPRIPLTGRANRGNHAGFGSGDLMVPVLMKGPDLVGLSGPDPIWLFQLFTKYATDIPFDNPEPVREYNQAFLCLGEHAFGTLTGQLRLSPAYRWRVNVGNLPSQAGLWVEYDVLSTFLTRWWVGVGVVEHGSGLDPSIEGTVELSLGRLTFSMMQQVTDHSRTFSRRLDFRITPDVSALMSDEGFGMSYRW